MDVTARTHGLDVARQAAEDSEAIFAAAPILDPVLLERLFASIGGFRLEPGDASGDVAGALATAGVFASKGEARRMIQNGGLTVNGQLIADVTAPMPAPIDGTWWEVRIGKRRREMGRLVR